MILPFPAVRMKEREGEAAMAGRERWRRGVPLFQMAALAGGGLAASQALVSTWAGELAASWSPHVALFVLAVAVAALWARRWRWLAVQGVVLLALMATMVNPILDSAQVMARQAVPGGEGMRLAFANLNIDNREISALAAWLAAQDADVIVVTEVLLRHMDVLEAALAAYRWRLAEPRPHAFGQVVFSRLPILEMQTVVLDAGSWESPLPLLAIVSVDTGNGVLHVAGLHPYPPLMPGSAPERDAQLRQAGLLLAQLPGAKVVTGDFNATAWSPALRAFAHSAGLRGFNLKPTWPSPLGPAGIAIDHALVGDGLVITAPETSPRLGSDHRAIVVDLAPVGAQGSPGTP